MGRRCFTVLPVGEFQPGFEVGLDDAIPQRPLGTTALVALGSGRGALSDGNHRVGLSWSGNRDILYLCPARGRGRNADGGESRRLLGTLLTWMAERKTRVFLVATSNDLEQLPPELVRKGRFDEIFFVDLPAEPIRREILRIHLAKRQHDPDTFDLDSLARQTRGFSGAELEQAVVGALYTANAQGAGLSTEHIATEATRTRPLAVVMAEKIAYLRAWAAERTVPAD